MSFDEMNMRYSLFVKVFGLQDNINACVRVMDDVTSSMATYAIDKMGQDASNRVRNCLSAPYAGLMRRDK
jgi:hypothetical protein